MTKTNEDWSDGFNTVSKVYDKNIGTVSIDKEDLTSLVTDNKQVFTDWEQSDGAAKYVIIGIDGTGNKIWGWLGTSSGDDNESCALWKSKSMTDRGWNGSTSLFSESSTDINYWVKKSYGNIAQPFVSSEPVPLKKGSDGELKNDDGSLNTAAATQLLSQGYNGTIDDTILDLENIYFTLVFDCGYPSDVKTQISTLVQTKRDCVAIMDNGDNSTFNNAYDTRLNTHTFNTYFAALYEPYNKVYDSFTGQDVWFSPIYHMSYLLPRNDSVSEIWFAAAGLTRGVIDSIKELRYNPRLGQRDQMYMKQLNPIVKFNEGYTVYGQLTSQAKPSALQDLNIVRLVLYCKRSLEQFCRYFIFEQNDAITWNQVSGEIVGFLEDIKKRRGLYSYTVNVYSTEYLKKRKTFKVDVTLTPVRVCEKIELNFFIK